MKIKQLLIIFWILIVYIDYYFRFLSDRYITPILEVILKKIGLW